MAKNASNPGGTVVQLYFSQSAAQAVRPKLMLLAFAKVDRATTDLVRSLSSTACSPHSLGVSRVTIFYQSVSCKRLLRLTSSAMVLTQINSLQVTLTIPLEELGYFHPLTDQTSVDPGKYTLSVGRSAGDLSATTRTLIVTA